MRGVVGERGERVIAHIKVIDKLLADWWWRGGIMGHRGVFELGLIG